MISKLRASNSRAPALLAILITVLAAMVILACGGANSANSGSLAGGGTTTGGSNNAPKHFKAGQQVKVGDTWLVTINSVTTKAGTDIDQPGAGNHYLVIDVTLKNTSSQEQDLSSLLSFTLKDSTGQKYDETITTFTTPPDGKVAAGDLVRGKLAYAVPASAHSFELAFEADIISGGQTLWDLSA
jgi:hypothetical protein